MNMMSRAFAPMCSEPARRDLVLIGSVETLVAPVGRDLLPESGARALAEELQHFWEQRGFTTAEFEAERVLEGSRESGPSVWAVRSNLVNGVPPRQPVRISRPPSRPGLAGSPRQVLEALASALETGQRVTQASIAAQCGLSLVTISRVMCRLKELGFLGCKGRSQSATWVVLRDADGHQILPAHCLDHGRALKSNGRAPA